MSGPDMHEFLDLYQTYRYENQYKFYEKRIKEFEEAHSQIIWMSIILLGLTTFVGSLGSTNIPSGLKLTCQLLAAILPVLSTAIIAYSSLYGFEQQAKLYQDSMDNLVDARDNLETDILTSTDENQFAQNVRTYVEHVEEVFHDEQGQWGQLATKFKPQE